MFGLFDLLRLLMSVLIILPLSSVLRESGYYLAATILGAKEKSLLLGVGQFSFDCPQSRFENISLCTAGWSMNN